MRILLIPIPRHLLVLICFGSIYQLVAQDNKATNAIKRPATILLSAGVSEPMSKNQEYYDPYYYIPRYFIRGQCAQLGIVKPLAKYFDLLLSMHYSNFNLDVTQWENQLNSLSWNIGPVNSEVNQISKRSILGMQIGCNGSFPLLFEGRLRFETGIQIGLSRLWAPEYSVNITSINTPTSSVSTTHSGAKSANLIPSASLNFGLRYELKKYLCFTLQLEYMTLLSKIHYNLNVNSERSFSNYVYPLYSQVWEVTEEAGWSYSTYRIGIGWLIFR